MHTPSLLVATLACLSALAAAELERPKFYFPRHVKRQIWNNLTGPITTPARSFTLPSQESTSSSSSSSSSPLTSKRQTSDNGGVSPQGSAPTDSVTTVVIESTAIVMYSGSSPTTNTAGTVDSGQSPAMTTPATDNASAASTTSSDVAITFGPGGVIPPTASAPAISSTGGSIDPPATIAPPSAPSSSAAPAPAVVDSVLSNVAPVVSSTAILPAAIDSSVPSSSVAPIVVQTSINGINGPGTSVDPSSTPNAIQSIVTDTALPNAIVPTASVDPNLISSAISVLPQGISYNTAGGTGVTAAAAPAPTNTGVTDNGGSPTSTAATDNGAGVGAGAGSAPTSTIIVDTGIAPTSTAVIDTGIAPISTAVFDTGVSPTSTAVTDNGAVPTSTFVPDIGVTASDNGTFIGMPTAGGTQAVIGTDTTVTPTADGLATGGVANVTDSATAAVTFATATDTPPITSSPPTGIDGGGTAWLPVTIATQSLPTASDATATTATGIPTTLPQAISPPTGIPQVPANTTMIQVGFLYALNYAFVVTNPNSSAQIFMFLPLGLANGLSIRDDQVTMHSLNPYDTQNTLGFITTLATAYIPSNMVSTLQQSLHQPLSPLYHDPDQSVNTLMSYINPAIPLIPGSSISDGTATGTGTDATPSTTAGGGGTGVFNTDSQNASATTKGTTAVIAVASISAAAAYGAAMFFIARRYKKRRSTHRRASSITSPSQMKFTGSPALMGGAMMSGGRGTPGLPNGRESRGSGRSAGNSARTVEISAPMMAENSLGWN